MIRLGKFVTAEELQSVVAEHRRSGMWLSDGTPLGDPAYEVLQLARKYGLPDNSGLDLSTGEWISKEMPENPYDSVEYERFVQSMVPHCHCAERYRPCDGVLAGGICDNMGHDDLRESEFEELDDL